MRKPHLSYVMGVLDEQMLGSNIPDTFVRTIAKTHDEAGLEWLYD